MLYGNMLGVRKKSAAQKKYFSTSNAGSTQMADAMDLHGIVILARRYLS
jgi:hypothetical protein